MITPDATLTAIALALDAYLALRELDCETLPHSPLAFANLAGINAVRLLPEVPNAHDARRLWTRMIAVAEVAEVYARWIRAATCATDGQPVTVAA